MTQPDREEIKKIGRMLLNGIPLLLAVLVFIFGLFLINTAPRYIILWRRMITLPEPKHCVLCTDDRTVRTYPCLIKLSTGEHGQITVYDIGSEYLEKIQQFQETGIYTTFSFVADRCQTTATEAHSSTSTLTIPAKVDYINPSPYCLDCRAKIGNVLTPKMITKTDYVLADMYDLEHIRIYPILDGAEYDIQGYTVTISRDRASKDLEVSVTGYFD